MSENDLPEAASDPGTTRRLQDGTWPKGVSGNPIGRPRGARHRSTLAVEALLDGEAEGLTRKAIEVAMEGDNPELGIMPVIPSSELQAHVRIDCCCVWSGIADDRKLLGHTQVQTTARYAHLAADPVLAAADQVSKSLA